MFKKLFGKKENAQSEVRVESYVMSDVEKLRKEVQESNHDEKTELPYFSLAQVNTFEAILKQRYDIEAQEEDIEDEEDAYALKMDLALRLYEEIMPQATKGELEYFVIEYGAKLKGRKTYQSASAENTNNTTIYGIDFETYAKTNYKIASGVDYNQILDALKITSEQWEEVSNSFLIQMQEDTTGNLTILYSQYMIPEENNQTTSNPLHQNRTFFQDVYAYFLSANELGQDGEALTIQKFNYNNIQLQQALQVWMEKESSSYEEYILGDDFFKERCATYKRELQKNDSIVSYDLLDFGKQAKLIEVSSCIAMLGEDHSLAKFLKTRDEDYGKVLLFNGSIKLVGDFSTIADEIYSGNPKLEDEEIGIVAVLGDLDIEGDAKIASDMFVQGSFSARSVNIYNDEESQVISIFKDCIVRVGLFIQNTIINLYIEGTLKTALVFSAIEQANVKVKNISENTLGINGYVDEDELGSTKLLTSLGIKTIINTDKLKDISNFNDDETATEDIIGDIIDGSITFRN